MNRIAGNSQAINSLDVNMVIDENSSVGWCDYYEFIKLCVVMLLMFIVIVGMFLFIFSMVFLDVLILGFLGMVFVMVVVVIVNQVVDYCIDFIMVCIYNCFIVKGKISILWVLIFVVILFVLFMFILFFFINMLMVFLILFGIVGYVFVYMMYLKWVMF